MTYYTAGSVITAEEANAWLPLWAQKPSATSRANNVTEAADPDLSLTFPANTAWDFRLVLYLAGGNAAGDWSGHLEWTDGVVSYSGYSVANSLASGTTADVSAGPTSRLLGSSPGFNLVFGVSATGTIAVIEGHITVGSTDSDLTLYWAQDSSNGTATSVLEGSTFSAERRA